MRISRVRFWHLQYPLERRYGDANGLKQKRVSLICRIETEDGVIGWGETFAYAVNASNCQQVTQHLVGQDCAHPRRLVEQVAKVCLRLAGGVDIALIDILGKASGLSAAQLLGGALRSVQPAYASLQNVTADENVVAANVAEALRAMQLGYTSLKMKVGWHPVALDIEWVNAVIAALPAGVPIALDANRAMDLVTSQRLMEGLAPPERVMWFEEPLPNTLVAPYADLRQRLSVPIAGAESMPIAMIDDAIQSRAMDIINPDLVGHGGFDRLRRLSILSETNGVRLVPHVFDGQLVRIASLHFLATTPDWPERQAPFRAAPLECDISVNPLRDELLQTKFGPDADGCIAVPTGPGLGVEINEQVIARYGQLID